MGYTAVTVPSAASALDPADTAKPAPVACGSADRSQIWPWLGPVPPLEEYRVVRRDMGQACPLFRRQQEPSLGSTASAVKAGSPPGNRCAVPAGPLRGRGRVPGHQEIPHQLSSMELAAASSSPRYPPQLRSVPAQAHQAVPAHYQARTAELTYRKVAYPRERHTGLLKAAGRQVCHRALEYIPHPYGTIVRIDPHGQGSRTRGTGPARSHPLPCGARSRPTPSTASRHLRVW